MGGQAELSSLPISHILFYNLANSDGLQTADAASCPARAAQGSRHREGRSAPHQCCRRAPARVPWLEPGLTEEKLPVRTAVRGGDRRLFHGGHLHLSPDF